MTQALHFHSASPAMTQAMAAALAPSLGPGDVLALVGQLGTGKTCFVQGLARGVGVANLRAVNSPTFVLLNVYHGRLPIYHFDAYRLSGADAWLDLGADDLLYGDGVCLVEWADRVEDALPPDRLEVRFTHAGPSERDLAFVPAGSRARRILESAGAALRAAGSSEE